MASNLKSGGVSLDNNLLRTDNVLAGVSYKRTDVPGYFFDTAFPGTPKDAETEFLAANLQTPGANSPITTGFKINGVDLGTLFQTGVNGTQASQTRVPILGTLGVNGGGFLTYPYTDAAGYTGLVEFDIQYMLGYGPNNAWSVGGPNYNSSITTSNGLPSNTIISTVAVNGLLMACFDATGSAGLFVSTDGGVTWNTYTTANGLPSNTIVSVAIFGTTIYVGTNTGGLAVSTTNGVSWSVFNNGNSGIPNASVQKTVVSGGKIYVAMASAGISVSSNGGTSWTNYGTGTSGWGTFFGARDLFVNGSTIYTIGIDSTTTGLLVSTNGGTTWNSYQVGSTNVMRSVSATSGAIYIGANVGLMKSTTMDGSGSFTTITSSSGFDANQIQIVVATGSNTVYINTVNAKTFASSDGGTTWSQVGTILMVAPFLSGTKLYLGSLSGIQIFDTTGGITWVSLVGDLPSNFFSAGTTGLSVPQVATHGGYSGQFVYQIAVRYRATPYTTAGAWSSYVPLPLTLAVPGVTGTKTATPQPWGVFFDGSITTPVYGLVGTLSDHTHNNNAPSSGSISNSAAVTPFTGGSSYFPSYTVTVSATPYPKHDTVSSPATSSAGQWGNTAVQPTFTSLTSPGTPSWDVLDNTSTPVATVPTSGASGHGTGLTVTNTLPPSVYATGYRLRWTWTTATSTDYIGFGQTYTNGAYSDTNPAYTFTASQAPGTKADSIVSGFPFSVSAGAAGATGWTLIINSNNISSIVLASGLTPSVTWTTKNLSAVTVHSGSGLTGTIKPSEYAANFPLVFVFTTAGNTDYTAMNPLLSYTANTALVAPNKLNDTVTAAASNGGAGAWTVSVNNATLNSGISPGTPTWANSGSGRTGSGNTANILVTEYNAGNRTTWTWAATAGNTDFLAFTPPTFAGTVSPSALGVLVTWDVNTGGTGIYGTDAGLFTAQVRATSAPPFSPTIPSISSGGGIQVQYNAGGTTNLTASPFNQNTSSIVLTTSNQTWVNYGGPAGMSLAANQTINNIVFLSLSYADLSVSYGGIF